MESSRPPTIAKKVWHIFQVVYYMLRKGMPKRKLMMDLHLLLKRGKIASKALGKLMTFHSHHHHSTTATSSSVAGIGMNGFSCRSMDPNLSFYDPREVEFSCSNTPSYSYPSLATKRSTKNRHNHHHRDYDYAAAAAIAQAFDILNSTEAASAAVSDAESSVAPSPMKTPTWWRFGKKSPMVVRQLRVTDSPFPIKEDEEAADCAVDKEAEEFIRRFYEQLRRQQSIGATPEYYRVVRRG